jgi:hypothetical protein
MQIEIQMLPQGAAKSNDGSDFIHPHQNFPDGFINKTHANLIGLPSSS